MRISRVTLHAAGLAALVVTALFGAAAPASAAEPAPAAVAAWFAEQAPSVAGGVLAASAVDSEDEVSLPATGYTAGTPIRLYDWNPAFVSGGSDSVAVGTDVWVAGLLRDGAVVGTIAATQSASGTVGVTYVDDDVAAGTALVSGTVAGQVVQDPQLGGLVEVGSTAAATLTAEGLSEASSTAVDAVQGVDDLRSAVTIAHEPAVWDGSLDDEDTDGAAAGQTGEGAGGGLAAGAVLLLAALVAWWVVRRSSGVRRAA
ncbi:hypothetical protein [Actinoplanes awajinensis]|uniref:hypothetical protein n=1 Tax=Actinoplanes awajinensis TaxID=135946 RepID=UPI000B1B7C7F|nr:hypothetical protein [Actinoplanes awajinensis]